MQASIPVFYTFPTCSGGEDAGKKGSPGSEAQIILYRANLQPGVSIFYTIPTCSCGEAAGNKGSPGSEHPQPGSPSARGLYILSFSSSQGSIYFILIIPAAVVRWRKRRRRRRVGAGTGSHRWRQGVYIYSYVLHRKYYPHHTYPTGTFWNHNINNTIMTGVAEPVHFGRIRF